MHVWRCSQPAVKLCLFYHEDRGATKAGVAVVREYV
jgi:hypothetical protein